MKICIITWIGTGNFGTSLQSYSLHKKLQDLGYDVSLLEYFDHSYFSILGKYKPLSRLIKLKLKQVLGMEANSRNKQRKLRSFNNTNYNISTVSSKSQYNTLLKETDVFVTGSDQIWNCYNSYNPFYFLSFAKHNKRVAYASSMGTKDFPSERKEDIKLLLEKFDHIGVRERTAVDAITKLPISKNVRQVVDPTLLLDKHNWIQFAGNAQIEIKLPKKYILCYFVGGMSFQLSQIENIKKQYSTEQLIVIPSLENSSIELPGANTYKNAGPYEFVELIKNAECICTDSFHATTLSMLLEKEFIEFIRFADIDNSSQNSRIYDLLEHYFLMNRIYRKDDENFMIQPIDYSRVTGIVDEDRKECTMFLKKSIEN